MTPAMDENELAKVIREHVWSALCAYSARYLSAEQCADYHSNDLAQHLTAAGYAKRSDVVDECAKVAESAPPIDVSNHGMEYQVPANGTTIARAIRNLKDKP